jgi:hypothetical protein
MEFLGSDSFAVAEKPGAISGAEGNGSNRTPSESNSRSGESEGCCDEDDEEVVTAVNLEAVCPDLPIPSRGRSDFFACTSDSGANRRNRGFEEEEQVGCR